MGNTHSYTIIAKVPMNLLKRSPSTARTVCAFMYMRHIRLALSCFSLLFRYT